MEEKDLEKFKELYEKHFREKISQSEANDKAVKLLNLIRAVVSVRNYMN